MITVMADMAFPVLMIGECDAAVRTAESMPAVAAFEPGRKTSAIKQENCLPTSCKIITKGFGQFGGKRCSLAPSLIDQNRVGHRPVLYPGTEREFGDSSGFGRMERRDERRGRSEQDNCPALLSQNQRKIAGIVAQPVTLLVRCFMLFIDDQYPQVPDRSENGGPGSDNYPRLAPSDAAPFIVSL